MINRQRITVPNPLSFQYIVHALHKPIASRLAARRSYGPYTCQRMAAGSARDTGARFFYMEGNLNDIPHCNDGAFNLRLEWCDEMDDAPRGISRGWYCDDTQDQTIRGIVARLPHGRGFLAGWSMGAGMASELDTSWIIDDAHDACMAADDMAERAAERERDSDAVSSAEWQIEALRGSIADARKEYASLASEYRNYGTALIDAPSACRVLLSRMHRLRADVSDAVREINELYETYDIAR